MKVVVYGAGGYTGRLIVEHLVSKDVIVRILGRSKDTLCKYFSSGSDILEISLDDMDGLVQSFQGFDVVISSLAPYEGVGDNIVRAALKAKCHYVDVAGEQVWIHHLHQHYNEEAKAKGVKIMPAATDDGMLSDLLASLVQAQVGKGNIHQIRIHHGYFDTAMSRGSMKSFTSFLKTKPLHWHNGWKNVDITPVGDIEYPHGDGKQPSFLLAGPEVFAIQRHVDAPNIISTINMDIVAGLSSLTPEIIEAAPTGPSEEARKASRFTMLIDATLKDGRVIRAHVSGKDIYGLTAILAAESAISISKESSSSQSGVLAPAETIDSRDFLDKLAPIGVQWLIEK